VWTFTNIYINIHTLRGYNRHSLAYTSAYYGESEIHSYFLGEDCCAFEVHHSVRRAGQMFQARFIRVGSTQRGGSGVQRDRDNIMRIADSRTRPQGPSSSLTYAQDESGAISWAAAAYYAAAQHPWALILFKIWKMRYFSRFYLWHVNFGQRILV